MKITGNGLSYDFNKFIYKGVSYTEIEEFFEKYNKEIGLNNVNIIYNINNFDMLYFNKAIEDYSSKHKILKQFVIKKFDIISEGDFKPQWIKYTLSNGINIILTDVCNRLDYRKTYTVK